MASNKVRWAVVGTGPVTASFAKALRSVETATPLAVVSRDEQSAQTFARKHGFSFALPLGRQAFRHADIDVFYIATPTSSHRELSLAAIAAGKPVVCEKPMTSSLVELQAVAAAAGQAGVFAMEGMWLRFNPVIRQLRAELAMGTIGEILGVEMHIGYREQTPDAPVRDGAARDALTVFGCYGLSLAEYLFGQPEAILASGRRDPAGAVHHCALTLRYRSFTFVIKSSLVATLSNSLRVVGTTGTLEIRANILDPYRLNRITYAGRGGLAGIGRRLVAMADAVSDQFPSLHSLNGSGFRQEIGEVNACLLAGLKECETNSLASTIAVHKMIEAARASLPSAGWRLLAGVTTQNKQRREKSRAA